MPRAQKSTSSDLVPGPLPSPSDEGGPSRPSPAVHPTAGLAARLAEAAAGSRAKTVLFLAADERRADEIGRALAAFAPNLDVLVLPPWDCLPYDRVSPSPACMGRRVDALQRLGRALDGRRVVVTSPEAAVQKLAAAEPSFTLAKGDSLDRAALEAFARRCGYLEDERVDDPGDLAVHGQVIDIYPAAADQPIRIDVDEHDRIVDLRRFDAGSQRTAEAIDTLDLVPASELALPDDVPRTLGIEHRLPAFQPELRSIFALLPKAVLALDEGAIAACRRAAGRIADAYEARLAFSTPDDGAAVQPSHLYLVGEELEEALASALAAGRLKFDGDGLEPMRSFALERDATRALVDFVRATVADGRRVVLAGTKEERAPMLRALKRAGIAVSPATSWPEVGLAGPGVLAFAGDFEGGFNDREAGLAVVAAADVFGVRAAGAESERGVLATATAPQPGDVVVHEDHGVAVLRGLEQVEVDGGSHEVLRLGFHGDATLLVPVDEMDRIWRYGSATEAVTLDKLHTDGWNKRRVKVNAQVEDAAARLIAMARERDEAKTPLLQPPPAAYARFVARFPFPETGDQAAAVAAVLADLASGRPMNRLVCGDVGYGKPEVALRAAAAVALSGRQVALVAPTTVLARQHARTFAKRFAGTQIEIVHLSRLVEADEARTAKKHLADGRAGIVIGTQAVSSADFDDLALVIVDEEHRFGTKTKAALQALAPHHLALTATPIPRTLQGALVGVQDVSVLAAPPARRRPVRTFLSPFDKAAAATALIREKRRGGQSFMVVPRVEEIEGVLAMLKEVAAKLTVTVAHGQLPPDEVDEAMVRFAEGGCDVLVATSLIENGLDVPRANTMLVWGADRFGLAQLHQLRGRVGRGRVQGTAYLFTPADDEVSKTTAERLSALLAADRLGAGFALSTQDLDLRGGGDLVGEEQAGHIRLIGASLYQHLLARAVRAGQVRKDGGEIADDRRPPTLQIPGDAGFPAAYVPDEVLRLDLYTRLAHMGDVEDVDAFAEELDDRFGAVPPETARLLARRRVAMLAQGAGVSAVVVGPKAAAVSFLPRAAEAARTRMKGRWKDERLLLEVKSEDPDKNLGLLATLFARLGANEPAKDEAERCAAKTGPGRKTSAVHSGQA